MNIKKLSLTIVISLMTILLSSCDDRDYSRNFWSTGVLDTSSRFFTNYNGSISSYFTVDYRDIYPDNGGTIQDMKVYGSDEIALSISSYDKLNNLTLEVAGTNAYVDFINVSGNTIFYGSRDQDEGIIYFFDVLIAEINRRGYAEVNVIANGRNQNVRLDINLFAELDLYMRD